MRRFALCDNRLYRKDAIEDAPVSHPWHAAWLVGKHRLDVAPFMVIEFMSHGSRFRPGALNPWAAYSHHPRVAMSEVASEADIRETDKTDANHLIRTKLEAG